MDVEIDRLSIDVMLSSESAESKINAMIESLTRLKGCLQSGFDFNGIASGLETLNEKLQNFDSDRMKSVGESLVAFSKMSGEIKRGMADVAGGLGLSGIGDELKSFQDTMKDFSAERMREVSDSITPLAEAIGKAKKSMGDTGGSLGFSDVGADLKAFQDGIEHFDTEKMTAAADSLEPFARAASRARKYAGDTGGSLGFSEIGKDLGALQNSIVNFDAEKMTVAADSLEPFAKAVSRARKYAEETGGSLGFSEIGVELGILQSSVGNFNTETMDAVSSSLVPFARALNRAKKYTEELGGTLGLSGIAAELASFQQSVGNFDAEKMLSIAKTMRSAARTFSGIREKVGDGTGLPTLANELKTALSIMDSIDAEKYESKFSVIREFKKTLAGFGEDSKAFPDFKALNSSLIELAEPLERIAALDIKKAEKSMRGIRKMLKTLNDLPKVNAGSSSGWPELIRQLKEFADAAKNINAKPISTLAKSIQTISDSSAGIRSVFRDLQKMSRLDFSNLNSAAKSARNIARAGRSTGRAAGRSSGGTTRKSSGSSSSGAGRGQGIQIGTLEPVDLGETQVDESQTRTAEEVSKKDEQKLTRMQKIAKSLRDSGAVIQRIWDISRKITEPFKKLLGYVLRIEKSIAVTSAKLAGTVWKSVGSAAVKAVSTAMSGVGSAMKTAASKVPDIASTLFKGVSAGASAFLATSRAVASATANISKAFLSAVRSAAKFTESLFAMPFRPITSSLSSLASKLSDFIKSVKRVLLYRTIRTILHLFSTALKDGINNLYQYSKVMNTEFHKALDLAATDILYLKNSIGAMAAPLIQTVVPVLDKITDKLVDLFNMTGMLFAKMRGDETYTRAVKVAAEYAEAADEAAKATKDFLLGIDELNVFKPDDSGAAALADMFEEVPTDLGGTILGGMLDPFIQAWENEGANTVRAIQEAFQEVKKLLEEIGNAFRTVWLDGTGQKVVETILQIIQHMAGVIGNIAKGIREALAYGNNGVEIFRSLFGILQDILDMFNRILAAAERIAATLNFIPLFTELNESLKQIESLVHSITRDIARAFESSTAAEIAQRILDIWTKVLDIIGNLAEKLREAWDYNDNGYRSIQAIFDIFLDILNTVDRILGATAQWIDLMDFTPLFLEVSGALESIELLVHDIGDSIARVFESAEAAKTPQLILDIFTNLVSIVRKLTDRFREAWNANDNGYKSLLAIWEIMNDVLETAKRITAAVSKWADSITLVPLFDNIRYALENIEDLVGVIGDSIARVFESDEAAKTPQLILDIFTNILGITGDLAGKLAEAWAENDNGYQIILAVWTALNDILGTIKNITEAMRIWIANTDFSPLFQSVKDALWEVEGLIESIGDTLSEVFQSESAIKTPQLILDIFRNIADTVGGLAGALNEAWKANENGTVIVQSILDIFVSILETAKGITGVIAGWASQLDLVPLFDSLREMFVNIKTLVEEIGKSIVATFEDEKAKAIPEEILHIFQNIADTVGGLAGSFAEAWKSAGNGDRILAAVRDIVIDILNTVDRVTGAIAKWAQHLDLGPAVTAVANAMEDLEGIVRTLGDCIASVFEGGNGPWRSLGEQITHFLSGIISEMNAWLKDPNHRGVFMKELADFVNGAIEGMDWNQAGELLINGITYVIDSVITFVSNLETDKLGDALADFVNGAINRLSEWLDGTPKGMLGKKLSDFLNHAIETISWSEIASTMANLFLRILDEVGTFIDNLDTGKIASALHDFIKSAWDSASEWIRSKDWTNIGEILWNKLKSYLEGLDIQDISSAMFNCIADAVSALADLISGIDFGDVVATLEETISRFISGMPKLKIIGALVSLVVSLVLQIPSIVAGALEGISGSIADTFEGLGLDAIAGFFRGIEDALGKFTGFMSDHVVKPVTNFIQKITGNDSPMKELENNTKQINESISDSYEQTSKDVKESLDGISDGMQETSKSVQMYNDIMEAAFKDMSASSNENLGDVAKIMEEVGERIELSSGEHFDAASENVQKAWEDASTGTDQYWNNIKDELTGPNGVWTGLLEDSERFSDQIKKNFDGLWDGVLEDTEQTWADIRKTLNQSMMDISNDINENVNEMRDDLNDIWDGIEADIHSALQDVRSDISSVWDAINADAKRKWDAIRNTMEEKLEGIRDEVSESLEGLCDSILQIWDDVERNTANAWGSIRETLIDTWDGLDAQAGEIFEGIQDIISSAWDAVEERSKESWKEISDLLDDAWDAILKDAEGKFDALAGIVSDAFLDIQQESERQLRDLNLLIDGKLDDLNAGAEAQFKGLSKTIRKVWQEIRNQTEEIWDGIVSDLCEKWNGLSSAASVSFSDMENTVGAAWSSIEAQTKTAWDFVVNQIVQAIQAIDANVRTLESVTSRAAEAFESLSGRVQHAAENAGTAAGNMADQISGKVGQLDSDLKKKASSITESLGEISGFAESSLKNMSTTIGNTVQKAFKVEEAVKWGKDLILNFKRGLLEEIPGLGSELASVREWIRQAMTFDNGSADDTSYDYASSLMRAFTDGILGNEDLLYEHLTSAFDRASEHIETTLTETVQNIEIIWSEVPIFFSGIWSDIQSVYSGADSFFSETFSDAWNAVEEIWEYGYQYLTNGLEELIYAVDTSWETIETLTEDRWTSITNLLSNQWDLIMTNAWQKFEAMIGNIDFLWEQCRNDTLKRWVDIASVIDQVLEVIRDNTGKQFDKLNLVIQLAWSSTIQETEKSWNSIADRVESTLSILSHDVYDEFHDMQETILEVWDSVEADLGESLGRVEEILNQFTETVTDNIAYNITNVFLEMENTVEEAARSVQNSLVMIRSASAEAIADVKAALTDMSQSLSSAAKSVKTKSKTSSTASTPNASAKITSYSSSGYPYSGDLYVERPSGNAKIRTASQKLTTTPAEDLKKTMAASNKEVVSSLKDLIEAVKEIDPSISIGDEAIGRANDRYNSKRGYKVSSGVFASRY